MKNLIRHLMMLALLARTAVAVDLRDLDVILTVAPDDAEILQLTMVALNPDDLKKQLERISMVSARFELLQPNHLGSVGPGDSDVDAQWALVYEKPGVGTIKSRTVKISLSPDDLLDILRAQEFYMRRDSYGIRRHSGGYAYASPTNTIKLAIDKDDFVRARGHVAVDVKFTFTDALRMKDSRGKINSVAAIDVSEGLQYTTMEKSVTVPFRPPPGINKVNDGELTLRGDNTIRIASPSPELDSPFQPDDRTPTVRGDLPSVAQALQRAQRGDNSYMRFAADFGPQRFDDSLTEQQKLDDRSLKYNQLMPIIPVALMVEGEKRGEWVVLRIDQPSAEMIEWEKKRKGKRERVLFLPIDQLQAYEREELNNRDLLVIPPEAVRFVPGDKQWNTIIDDYLDLRKYKSFEDVFVAKVHDGNEGSEREMSVREMIGESDEVLENIGPKKIEESIMELHRDAPPDAKKRGFPRRNFVEQDPEVRRLLEIANDADKRRGQGEPPVFGQEEHRPEQPDLMKALAELRAQVAAQEDEIANLKEQRSDTQARRARLVPRIGGLCMKGLRILGKLVGIGR